jgi:hypothetical protein
MKKLKEFVWFDEKYNKNHYHVYYEPIKLKTSKNLFLYDLYNMLIGNSSISDLRPIEKNIWATFPKTSFEKFTFKKFINAG